MLLHDFSASFSTWPTPSSVSSAQLRPEGVVEIGAGTEAASLDGVIAPEAGLLGAPTEVDEEDKPLAA
jgi:hypothetical protein